jgi:DNA-binding MarR family transcriptional regulator
MAHHPTGAEHSLGKLLKRAEQAMVRAKSDAVRPAGITLAQYVALVELEAAPGITAATLARACLVTPQAMMVALKAMQEQGLIERRTHPRHRTVLEIYLTDEGREVLEVARGDVEPIERRVSDALSTGERDELATLLARFAQAIATPADTHGYQARSATRLLRR